MRYTYDKAVSIKQQWPKFKLEKDLIPKQLAKWEQMSALGAIRRGLVKSLNHELIN